MWNKDGQLYGVGDTSNLSYLWYDGGSAGLGDFSPFNGGGNVPVNEGGDTTPQAVRASVQVRAIQPLQFYQGALLVRERCTTLSLLRLRLLTGT